MVEYVEYVELSKAPGFDVLNDIMAEARGLFMYEALTDELVERMGYYFNNRVREEIAEGNFRVSFFTPSGRVALYKQITIRKDPEDPMSVLVLPKWVYMDTVPSNDR